MRVEWGALSIPFVLLKHLQCGTSSLSEGTETFMAPEAACGCRFVSLAALAPLQKRQEKGPKTVPASGRGLDSFIGIVVFLPSLLPEFGCLSATKKYGLAQQNKVPWSVCHRRCFLKIPRCWYLMSLLALHNYAQRRKRIPAQYMGAMQVWFVCNITNFPGKLLSKLEKCICHTQIRMFSIGFTICPSF